jgi:hypothetical protein
MAFKCRMMNGLYIKRRAKKKAVVASFDAVYYNTSCMDGMNNNTDIRGWIVALQKDFETTISDRHEVRLMHLI